MESKEFEDVVAGVLDNLPADFAEKLENVEVVVEDLPTKADLETAGVGEGLTLLGLYHGVPLSQRGWHYMLVLPDRISIYREPIERVCRGSKVPVDEMIRRVVLHEIAHHFGIPDERLRELGY
jgi:predicted Zn-dependent protease with MMP-like domain